MAAVLYRMEMKENVCPSGLKARALLKSKGIAFEDHTFKSRQEVNDFKSKHGVTTTPQIWLDGKRIGGFDALQAHFGDAKKDKTQTSYTPVIALFAMAAFMAVAMVVSAGEAIMGVRTLELFVAVSMCLLALQKLRDIEAFADQFITYDLLAMRWLPYAKFYPFAEGGAGILMIAGALSIVSIPVMLFIGGLGAVSVHKAVYIDKRELRCACVGGNSNVPLGFVSLTENLMMLTAGAWMLAKVLV
ncbi:MAG: MauE/DoxX family redox-associated membrane protein [Pseudomonadota bacterium]